MNLYANNVYPYLNLRVVFFYVHLWQSKHFKQNAPSSQAICLTACGALLFSVVKLYLPWVLHPPDFTNVMVSKPNMMAPTTKTRLREIGFSF